MFSNPDYRSVQLMKDMQGGYLSKIPGLKKVTIEIYNKEEAALEKLEPHPNLKKLELWMYGGRTIPWWRRANDNSATINQFSNLVHIRILKCENLVSLPSFSKLPFLKSLKLEELKKLEYMETRSSLLSEEATDATTFFPSLQTLHIRDCTKWEGRWFREEGFGDADYGSREILSFPRLSTLEIWRCDRLMSFPHCPSVKKGILKEVHKTSQLMNKMMGLMGKEEEQQEQGEVTIGNHTSSSLSASPPSCLATLIIRHDYDLKSLSEFEKVFEMCASSLQDLTIVGCPNLSRFARGLEHLTALEKLRLLGISQLKFSEDGDDIEEIMAWKPLHQSLHSLEIFSLGSMKSLPKGMQYLTSLQILMLIDCRKLKGLPEWISCLSSLQSLTIKGCYAIESLPEGIQALTSLQTLIIHFCSGLKKRCREPDGQDWPKIQHIPNKELI